MSKARLYGTAIDGTTIGLTATQSGQTAGPLTIPNWGVNIVAPTISGIPTITGTMEVGQTISAVAAPSTGTAPITTTWQWRRNGSPISGATSQNYTLVEADDPSAITVVQTDTNDAGSDSKVSAPRSVGVTEIEYQLVYTGQQDAGGTLADSFTVPVPATLTGNWTLYIMLGSGDTFTALDVDTVAATRIVPTNPGDQTANSGGRMSLFSIDVTGLTGSGNLALDATLFTTENEYLVTIFAVRGGVLQDQFADYFKATGAGESLGWGGVKVPGDGALMVGLTSGRDVTHVDEGDIVMPAWGTLDQVAKITAVGDTDAQSIAWRTLMPAGVYDEGVDFNSSGPDRVTAALLVFVPIGAPVPPETVSLWTLADEAAVTGDMFRLDIQGNPFKDGYRVSYYEIEIQKTGGTVVERVLAGGANNYVRKHRADANATTTCRLRPVFMNQTTGALYTAAWSDPLNVTTTTGAARVSMTATRATVYTGEAFIVEIEPRGFNTLRAPVADLDYWTTVDASEAGDLTYGATYLEAELGPNGKRRDLCRAHKWAFAAKTTGAKTFTTNIRDRHGNIAMTTLDVTVVDPVSDFDPANIYALSSASNFTGVPAGANTYTSFAALKAATPTSGPILFMIDEDEVSGDAAIWNITAAGITEVHFRSYGPGLRKPELDFGLFCAVPRFSWWGVDIKTAYDPTNYPSGVSFRPEKGIETNLCAHAGIGNCMVRGANLAYLLPKKGRVSAYHDVACTDWANFGFFGDDVGKYAIFGAEVMQEPDTIRFTNKYETDPPVFPDHGCHRTSRPNEDHAICKFVGFCVTSWGGIQSPQPTFRIFGSGATPRPLSIMVSQSIMLGLGQGFGHTSRAGGLGASRPQDVRVDSSVVYGAHSSNNGFAAKCGLTTITNCKITSPGGPRELDPFNASDTGGSGFRAAFQMHDDRENGVPYTVDDNANNPVRIRFCTVLDLNEDSETSKDAYVRTELISAEPMLDYTYENLVEHAPNYTTSLTTDAPLDMTFHGVAHPYQARYYFNGVDAVVTETQYGVPNDAMCLGRPLTGSAAIGGATGLIEVRDAWGNLRPASGASRGWLEPV